ncbi:cadmium resistance transporter [Leuconostocaceae bacterium ESL0723]|nr:cadmium resistance transporter [Leuconostocaceae bacterium ESL0723]
MLQTYLTALLSYLGTTADYVVVLLLLFSRYRRGRQVRAIIAGAYLGNAALVLAALLVATVLRQVPAQWVLGLLGLVPMAIGLKNYFSNKGEGEAEAFSDRLAGTGSQQIVWVVVGMTIAACGADNMTLYIPYFTLVASQYLLGIFGIFAVVLTLAIFFSYRLAQVGWVATIFERFGDLIQVLVYVALGIYILFDAGTVQHVLSLL